MIEVALFFIIFGIGYAVGHSRKGLMENSGEGYIRKLLTEKFHSPEYHLLNNLTLPIVNGTTQVDHVLVSTSGVFVIETKKYSGWIFANEKSANWTQVIYKNKSSFQNPLRQNYLHQKTIEKMMDFLPREAFHSVVVFVGDAKFKTTKPKRVFDPSELISFIEAQPDGVLSQNRVQFVVGRLECARYQMSEKTDYEHQSYLHKKFGDAGG